MSDDLVPRSPATSGQTNRLALVLGYSGLLPMAGILISQWFWPAFARELLQLSMLYVGVIFSFLGGIQWGLILHRYADADVPTSALTTRLIVSVLPALLTVVALIMPAVLGCLVFGIGLWLLMAFEWLKRKQLPHPTWYLPLRLNLTTLLSGTLAGTLWMS
jgi:hypothetical protein